jgi:hypothetical protein
MRLVEPDGGDRVSGVLERSRICAAAKGAIHTAQAGRRSAPGSDARRHATAKYSCLEARRADACRSPADSSKDHDCDP